MDVKALTNMQQNNNVSVQINCSQAAALQSFDRGIIFMNWSSKRGTAAPNT